MKKAVAAPAPGASGSSDPQTPGGVQAGSDDEDVDDNLVEEGDAEAPVPGDFEYLSDGGEGDDE